MKTSNILILILLSFPFSVLSKYADGVFTDDDDIACVTIEKGKIIDLQINENKLPNKLVTKEQKACVKRLVEVAIVSNGETIDQCSVDSPNGVLRDIRVAIKNSIDNSIVTKKFSDIPVSDDKVGPTVSGIRLGQNWNEFKSATEKLGFASKIKHRQIFLAEDLNVPQCTIHARFNSKGYITEFAFRSYSCFGASEPNYDFYQNFMSSYNIRRLSWLPQKSSYFKSSYFYENKDWSVYLNETDILFIRTKGESKR